MENTIQKKKRNTILIPSMIALGVIPLITHAFNYDNQLTQFIWFPDDSGKSCDFFLAWKMIAIITVGAVMTMLLLVQRFVKHNRIRFESNFYALFIYGVFVAVSALLSQYKHWVVCGSYQMFESVWVLFAYIMFCFYTYQYVRDESQIRSLLMWGGVGIVILTLIGTFQFIGLDFFKSKIGRLLITNPSNWKEIDKIQFQVPKHTVYATLYNQNFLSFYCGMMIPLILGLIIGCKKLAYRIVLIVVEILAMACMLGASSSSSWIALAGSAVIVAFVLFSRKKKAFKTAGIVMGIGIAAVIAVCVLTPIGNAVSASLLGTPAGHAVREIDTTGDSIIMNINHKTLQVTYDYNEVSGEVSVNCMDENGKKLATTPLETGSLTSVIDDKDYIGCAVTPMMVEDILAVDVTVDGHNWYFAKTKDDGYCMINQAGKLERYKSPEFSYLFYDNALNGRGRIWDGVLPILRHYLLVGSGANTFIFAYPQNDYIYREYNNMQNTLDVKPHSLYLQQWVENGLIAMCAFLVFCLGYLVNCIRIYRKADLHESLTWTGIGLFTGVLAYLIVGIANDSNVCTAPVFWILLGLGMAVNRMLSEKLENENEA